MKVLFVNKFFFLKGGSESAFFETAELLEKKGHQLSFFSMKHSQNFPSSFSNYFVSNVDMNQGNIFQKIKTAVRILYSVEARNKIKRLIRREKPDVAHLNNIYHHISPSIIDELKKRDVPILMTLHDYKLTCPTYYHLAPNGKICEKCATGYYNVLFRRCVKDSYTKSALCMLEMYLHHKILRIYNNVDLFTSPSRFLMKKTRQMGFMGKIVYLPNFINILKYKPSFVSNENSIIYFGRLSREKGLVTLIDAVKKYKEIKLKIIGDGPLKESLKLKVEAENLSNIIFRGFKLGDKLREDIASSLFTVIPSEWYENNPRSILESFAMGKPVIGSRIGGIPELVKDGETGFTFEPGNSADLNDKIGNLYKNKNMIFELGKNARAFIEKELDADEYYDRIMKIYQQVLKDGAIKQQMF